MVGRPAVRPVVRPATMADEGFLLELLNTQDVKFWSGRKRDIGTLEHHVWLEDALKNPFKHSILIAGDPPAGDPPLGYGRLEYVTEARVSFAVQREFRHCGVGKEILRALSLLATSPLVAYVHASNGPSIGAFLNQGYSLDETRTEKGVLWQVLRKP